MFFYRFDFGVGMVVGFFVGLAAGAIWLTFLYNGTRGSALMAVLWHTSWNVVNQLGLVLSDVIVAVMSTCVMVSCTDRAHQMARDVVVTEAKICVCATGPPS